MSSWSIHLWTKKTNRYDWNVFFSTRFADVVFSDAKNLLVLEGVLVRFWIPLENCFQSRSRPRTMRRPWSSPSIIGRHFHTNSFSWMVRLQEWARSLGGAEQPRDGGAVAGRKETSKLTNRVPFLPSFCYTVHFITLQKECQILCFW